MTALLVLIIVICILSAEVKKERKEQKALDNAKQVKSNIPYSILRDINSGNLPIIEVNNINYLPNEKCHYVDNAVCFLQSGSTSYQRISNGTYTKSKNGGHRTSISTTYPVITSKTNIYEGALIITNERIIFINDKYSLCVPLSCVISFTPYNNKIDIYSGKRIDSIYVPNGFIISNLLNSIYIERNK